MMTKPNGLNKKKKKLIENTEFEQELCLCLCVCEMIISNTTQWI